jgi:nitrous oxide reductase accessory protein NosL
VPGVMNYTSRIAFSTLEKAEDFQKKHGGSIISFKQALEEIE